MASDLITTPVVVDAGDLAQIGFASIQTDFPDWEPSRADGMTILIRAFAAMIAENQTLVTQALSELVQYLGAVQGLRVNAATAATVASTWTLLAPPTGTTPVARAITAGTNVAVAAADGTPVTFYVQQDVVVSAGSNITGAGEVTLVAADLGAVGTGLSGRASPLDGDVVDTIALVGTSTGGQDAEDPDAYLARYTRYAQILKPSVVIASNAALFVQVLFSQVDRVLGIDMLDPTPTTGGTDVERCFTLIPIDALGQPLPIKDAIKAALQAVRETSFQFFVIDPHYTPVDVTATFVPSDGYDPADVAARATAAVTALLNPANHGRPSAGDQSLWLDRRKVYFQDVVTALNNVDGLDRYATLTVNGGTSDIALSGPTGTGQPGGLPQPGTISVTPA